MREQSDQIVRPSAQEAYAVLAEPLCIDRIWSRADSNTPEGDFRVYLL